MTIDQFWQIIDQCSPHSFDMGLKCRSLEKAISTLTPDELRAFTDHYWSCRTKAYHWPLWDAASISHGGCGDDSFMDYRSSLITFGRDTFESALSDPDSLGDLEHPIPRSQDVYVVIHSVAERMLGPNYRPPGGDPSEPTGESIEGAEDYDSIALNRFPKLHAQRDRISATIQQKKPWWKLW
ncbi:DUF4240 domain-containing protein [Luteolibacter soli]|uniref:DUF4240 domain-containing protein n=1 Tax=Luteolibacter soli TaxID=3135280 RepID=A0ABU9AV32_9BACT